jgi:hypothetical protein
MTSKYSSAVAHVESFLAECERLGLGDTVIGKGGVPTLVLAAHLDHLLVPGDKGADARGADGLLFEYKVSATNQYAFNFGPRTKKNGVSPEDTIRKHFENLAGAYCAARTGARIREVAFCPSGTLVAYLIDHFKHCQADQLTKVFSMAKFLKVPGAYALECAAELTL